MKEGALILVDCLGFRGIWNRVDPEKLITRLHSIEAEAFSRVVPKYSSSMLSFGAIRFHLRLLSDTVVLSIQYEAAAYSKGAEPDERQKSFLVSIACESASILARLFIDSDVPLPLRGCISFGRHLCEGNFLIGPAVDQAAEYMNEPEGAFIWVLPGVAERHNYFRTRALAIMDQPKETIMAAHAIAVERGAKGAAELLMHPEAGSDLFVEALRLTYAQILGAPIIIEAYPMGQHHRLPTRLLDWSTRSYVAAYFAVSDLLGGRAGDSGDRLAVWVLNIEQKALFPKLKVVKVPGSNNMNLAAQAGIFTLLEQQGIRGAPFEGETSLDLYLAGQPLPPPLLKVTLPVTEASAALKLCSLYGVTGATLFPDYSGAARATEDIMRDAIRV